MCDNRRQEGGGLIVLLLVISGYDVWNRRVRSRKSCPSEIQPDRIFAQVTHILSAERLPYGFGHEHQTRADGYRDFVLRIPVHDLDAALIHLFERERLAILKSTRDCSSRTIRRWKSGFASVIEKNRICVLSKYRTVKRTFFSEYVQRETSKKLFAQFTQTLDIIERIIKSDFPGN